MIELSYNSCRNRHCPKCQGLKQALWADAQRARLLPVPYYHAIFTVAAEARPLFLAAPRVCYSLLFEVVAEVLQQVARQKLKAEIGFTAVLHTWTQLLAYHPHLHVILPGGGLSLDGSRFVHARKGFFLPVLKLRFQFRKRLIAKLREAVREGLIPYDPADAQRLLDRAAKKTWVVQVRSPIHRCGSHIIDYLSRYVSRVAIANSRILRYDGQTVTFRYKDRKRDRVDQKTVTGAQFAALFLAHLLPPRFRRIRHYGLLAARRSQDLARCRELLNAPPVPTTTGQKREDWVTAYKRLFGSDPRICRHCGRGIRVVIETFRPLRQ